MDDLIRREEAKAAIRKMFLSLADRVEINSVLNDLPSVSTEKTERWIPVSEPPKEEGRYICDYGDCIDFGSYHDGHWYIQGAVAYMPLPQPYKEESEE